MRGLAQRVFRERGAGIALRSSTLPVALLLLLVMLFEVASIPGLAAASSANEIAAAPAQASGQGRAPHPAAGQQGWKWISYGGARIRVPLTWPVYDLSADPATCLRFDRHAVYLGEQGPDPSCPAHAVGKTGSVQLQLTTPEIRARFASGRTEASTPGKGTAFIQRDAATSRTLSALFPGVLVTAAFGADRHIAEAVLRSVRSAGATRAPAEARSNPVKREPLGSPTPTSQAAASSVLTGPGFDTCAAPSTSTMSAWLSSPYRSIGIYIGGADRACGDGNLSASWVSTVTGQGWAVVPLYVGLQAPCWSGGGGKIDPANAQAQGINAADDATARAQFFGLAAGSPIYFDMEGYGSGASCRNAVLTFLTAWTNEIHAQGYVSGVYSSVASGIHDLSTVVGNPSYAVPDDIWFAWWNGVADTNGGSYFPSTYWTNHQRLHQYSGGHVETWGGSSINIDSDYNDGAVVSAGGCVDYPRHNYGPDGCSGGFAATGPLRSWFSGAPGGLAGQMLWVWSNGPTELDGATWAPTNLSPETSYDVAVYVPSVNATANAHYLVTDGAGVASDQVVEQAAHPDRYVDLGTYDSGPDASIIVHLSDAGDAAGTTEVGVDAVQFARLQSLSVTHIGRGRVTSRPSGIRCPSDCSYPFPKGTRVTLFARPQRGWHLVRWTGHCSGRRSCKVTMSTARLVHVRFAKN